MPSVGDPPTNIKPDLRVLDPGGPFLRGGDPLTVTKVMEKVVVIRRGGMAGLKVASGPSHASLQACEKNRTAAMLPR